LVAFAAALPVYADSAGPDPVDTNWPSFRGHAAAGFAEGFPTPVNWNADDSEGASLKNVLWKVKLPGLSHSSPIVWGERIFVATAVSDKANPELKVGLYGAGDSADDDGVQSWDIYCLDKKSGKTLWTQTVHRGKPRARRHTKATHANTTLATDGKNLVAFFGSEGLYCYDLNGKRRWKKDLGVLPSSPYDAPSLQWGWASSPVIHDGRVFLQCDILDNGFIACFDVRDGNEVWRNPRSDVATWSTPTIHVIDGKPQMIVNGWRQIGGYDARTGEEVWRMQGGGDIPVPAPVVAGDMIYIANAHGRISPIYAIKTTAKGDVTIKEGETSNAHVAWW
jgi:outer membrane protein assembly factor BamB